MYCNALLYGLPDREINRLQSIQNGTVRLVSGDKRFEYIVPAVQTTIYFTSKYSNDSGVFSIMLEILLPVNLRDLGVYWDETY